MRTRPIANSADDIEISAAPLKLRARSDVIVQFAVTNCDNTVSDTPPAFCYRGDTAGKRSSANDQNKIVAHSIVILAGSLAFYDVTGVLKPVRVRRFPVRRETWASYQS